MINKGYKPTRDGRDKSSPAHIMIEDEEKYNRIRREKTQM